MLKGASLLIFLAFKLVKLCPCSTELSSLLSKEGLMSELTGYGDLEI